MDRWQRQRHNECLFQYMRLRSLTGHLAPITLVRLLWHMWGLLQKVSPTGNPDCANACTALA